MKDTEEKQFGSMISCGRHLIKTYGFMRLFRGNFISNGSNMTQQIVMLSQHPQMNQALNESFDLLIQVLLEIFFDFGHQVSRLL